MKKILVLFTVLFMALGISAQEAEDPIIIQAPDTFVNKGSLTFTEQGITFSLPQCSAYPASHEWNSLHKTYFACLAGGTMTISAERAIKGIAINGWVRKNFSASCDHGTINYLSDAYDDAEGNPVLTISDIDATSVAITCNNQLRCFEVRVYFEQNPDSIGGTTPPVGEVYFFEYDTIDFAYNSEFSSENHYDYYLYLWDKSDENRYVGIDLITTEQDVFEGMYSFEAGNMTDDSFYQFGENYEDYSYATEGQMVINQNEDGSYSISGYITCENGDTYNFSYPKQASEGIILTPGNEPATKELINGHIRIRKNGRIFTATGTEIR